MASVTIAQYASANAHSVSSLAKAFTSNNTSGNMLVAFVGVWRSSSLGTITIADSHTQTYVSAGSATQAGNASRAFVWIFPNCASGANTITISSTLSATDINLDIFELAGTPTSSATDGFSVNSTGTSLTVSGDITTANSSDLIFGYVYDQSHSGDTFTPSAGFVLNGSQNNNSTGGECSAVYTLATSAVGTFAFVVTSNNGSTALYAIVFAVPNTATTPATVVQYTAQDPSGASLSGTSMMDFAVESKAQDPGGAAVSADAEMVVRFGGIEAQDPSGASLSGTSMMDFAVESNAQDPAGATLSGDAESVVIFGGGSGSGVMAAVPSLVEAWVGQPVPPTGQMYPVGTA
jgi:hypothetical protein